MDELLDTLERWLPYVREGAFLASLIEQAAYCARSLSRSGLDFSALARRPFRHAVCRVLETGLAAACAHWPTLRPPRTRPG